MDRVEKEELKGKIANYFLEIIQKLSNEGIEIGEDKYIWRERNNQYELKVNLPQRSIDFSKYHLPRSEDNYMRLIRIRAGKFDGGCRIMAIIEKKPFDKIIEEVWRVKKKMIGGIRAWTREYNECLKFITKDPSFKSIAEEILVEKLSGRKNNDPAV
jgi:hypothetical protein